MARPNLLRQKLAAGRTCVGPIFQELPELIEFCGLVPVGEREREGQPVISATRTGRCSWSDRVAASAIRSASTPSRPVHGLGASPRATRRNAASSAR